MRYIKFISKENQQHTGILNSDSSIQTIEGDIFNEYELTNKKFSIDDVKEYLFPVEVPNIIALGLNYKAHAAEGEMDIPKAPLIFLKATSSLNFHEKQIVIPKAAPSEVDFEAELAIVIGKKAKDITPEQVSEYILGYTCANDISARDCQLKIDQQWARGKSFDTFCPVGPFIETELDPNDLRIQMFLNGECMQDARTKDLIFSVASTVSYLSQNMTLLPGTLILTGTPEGVGVCREPQVFLKSGDKLEVKIEGIGSLKNKVVAL